MKQEFDILQLLISQRYVFNPERSDVILSVEKDLVINNARFFTSFSRLCRLPVNRKKGYTIHKIILC